VHAAGIEFDDALFIGQSAEAYAVILRIVLAADADVMRGFERVNTIEEHLVCLLDRLVAGDAGDNDRLRRRLELLDRFGCLGLDVGSSTAAGQAESGSGKGAKREEVTAGCHGGDVNKAGNREQ
jgi:hypothetical protein